MEASTSSTTYRRRQKIPLSLESPPLLGYNVGFCERDCDALQADSETFPPAPVINREISRLMNDEESPEKALPEIAR